MYVRTYIITDLYLLYFTCIRLNLAMKVIGMSIIPIGSASQIHLIKFSTLHKSFLLPLY